MPKTKRPFDKQRSFSKDVSRPLIDLLHQGRVTTDRLGELRYGVLAYDIWRYSAARNLDDRVGLPRVLITGGVHGNEPAGTLAALETLAIAHEFAGKCNLDVVPCVNPSGYEAATRVNADGRDVNRGFKKRTRTQECRMLMRSALARTRYDLAIDLHETLPHESTMGSKPEENPLDYYLYETAGEDFLRIGDAVIAAVKSQNASVSAMPLIYGDVNTGGVIRYPEGCGNPEYAGGSSLDAWLFANGADVTLVSETPTWWSLERRVSVHVAAVRAAIHAFTARY